MSNNSGKIVFGLKLLKDIPKVSLGKYIFDCLKKGCQDIAVVDAHTGSALTYEQILQNSIKLANYYRLNNIKKGDVIVILSENNINYSITVLAALYVGATVHPLNVNLTLWELAAMFRISKPKWIFCSEKALILAEQLKNEFFCVQTIITFGSKTHNVLSFEELLERNGPDLENFEMDEVNPEVDVAYILCSSGTSGLPKCVMLTHYSMVSCIEIKKGYKKIWNFERGDVVLIPVPFSHAYGFICFQEALSRLGKVVIMKKFIPELYLKSIELYKVKYISCPPLLLKFLAQSHLVDLYDLSSIRCIAYASAPSDPAINVLIRERFNLTPRQIYGTTETAGGCFYTPISLNKPGSCGIVIPELMMKVCDIETQEVLGHNQCGEICIKGPTLMKGYMGNSEETKNCIDDDGFYHTGDIGYYDEDEFIFITDRLKDLIKFKGYQVSPVELEHLILKHVAIKEVAVIGIPDERAGEVPLAYVVVNETSNINVSENEIVEFVAKRISASKRLYGGVKFIKELPKNNNGKVLKRVLQEIYKKSLTK